MRRLFVHLFAFALALTLNAQTEVVYQDDFQGAVVQTSVDGWVESSASRPPARLRGVQAGRASAAYRAAVDPTVAGNIVYGAKNPGGDATLSAPRTGVLATLSTFEFSGTTEYSGRFLRTSRDTRLGIALHSSAPQRNAYYLLGVWGGTAQLFSVGAGALVGTTDTHVALEPNEWYRFRAEVSEASGATLIRGRVWPATVAEPAAWSVEAVDASTQRLRSGRLGLWSALAGEAAFDDLHARSAAVSQVDTTAPAIRFTSPAAGVLLPGAQVIATGFADDAVTIVVNGAAATIDPATHTFVTAPITLLEGSNTLAAAASDAAGNQGSASVDVVVDTRAPELTVVAPVAGACVDVSSLTVTGLVFDPALSAIKVRVNGAAAVEATIAPDRLSWSAALPAIPEGKVLVDVVAEDLAGHTSSRSIPATIDRSPPLIVISANGKPLGGMLTNRSVTPAIDSSDADASASLVLTLDAAPYAQGVDVSAEGEHELRATATDCAGHRVEHTAAFTIDRTPPELISVTPAQSETVGARGPISGSVSKDTVGITLEPAAKALVVTNGSFSFDGLELEEGTNVLEFVLTDRAGNVARVPYRVRLALTPPEVEILNDGTPIATGAVFTTPVRPEIRPTQPDATVTATLNGAPFTTGTVIAADGTYTIVASASDRFGHASPPLTTSFTVDATAPVVKITSPADGSSVTAGEIDVRGTTDAANGTPINVSGVNTFAASGAFVALVPLDFGPNVITASTMDAAGNVSADSVAVTRAGGASGIILTAPVDGMVTNRRTTLVAGQVLTPAAGVRVTIGATPVSVDPSGRFRALDFALAEGENVITATLTNSAAETNQASVRVVADRTPPHLRLLESGQPLADQARFADRAVITTVATDQGQSIETALAIDGVTVAQPATVVDAGGHTIVASARDAAGNESRIERTIFIGTAGSGGCALEGFDPPAGTVVNSTRVTLVGRSGGAAGVKVNGVAALVSDGSFCSTIELPQEGENAVTVVCTDAEGGATGAPVVFALVRATDSPSIAIDTPAEGAVVVSETVRVSGSVSGATAVEINGVGAAISGASFSVSDVRLSPGLNVIVARARTASGKITTASRRILYVRDAGAISITSPLAALITGASTVDVSGLWSNVDAATITANGVAVEVTKYSDAAGSFVARVPLSAGTQAITVSARDLRGALVSASVTVTLIAGSPSISIEEPRDNSWAGASSDTLLVRGSFAGSAGSQVEVNGVMATVDAAAATFSASVPFATAPGGTTPVVARVTEPGGSSSIDVVRVTRLATHPRVVEGFPAPGATDVDPGVLSLVLFNAPMDRAAVAGAFSLQRASGETVAGELRLERDVLSFAPSALLAPGERYIIRVSASAKDLGGNPIESPWSSEFTVAGTAAPGPPVLTGVPSRVCAQQLALAGTASPGARLSIQLGALTFTTAATSTGGWSFSLPLSGQSGHQVVRVRVVGSDGSLSSPAEACFAVDCAGPHVVGATLDRALNRLTIRFSRAINPATVNSSSVAVTLADGRALSTSIEVQNPSSTVIVTPAENVASATITLSISTAIEDPAGVHLALPFTQTFAFESNEPPPPGDGSGFIAGEVFDGSTGRPLSGATVMIDGGSAAADRTSPAARSDASGSATDVRGRYVARLSEGAHTINITAPGFTSAWRQIVVLPGAGLTPIDVRLREQGSSVTAGSGAVTVAHETVQLDVPAGGVAPGATIALTSLGGQTLPGLLPLGWSPLVAATVDSDAPALSAAQLTFKISAAEIVAANQTVTAVEYQQERDEWRVIAPSVTIGSGDVRLPIQAPGTYALVYADRATGLAHPHEPVTGAVLTGVADPCAAGCPQLNATSFVLDPPLVLPTGRTVATLKIDGAPPAIFPSGTAVQAYIDEELRLADGTLISDPPFATDLLLYRTLDGASGVAQFELAPSPKAAEVILEVGFDRIRILPYPGRLDRGTLVGPEGGKVPGDGLVSVDIPAGAASEPLHATAKTIQDLTQFGTIAGFHVVAGFELTLARLDGVDAPVELLAPARVSFSQSSAAAQHVVVEVLDATPFGRLFRLVAQTSSSGGRIAARAIDRAVLPLDGVVREGRYLLLAADAPIAFASGALRIPDGAFLDGARITAASLGTASITSSGGVFAVVVPAAPAVPFTLIPRMSASGEGAAYTHASSPPADAVVNLGVLPFSAQPPSLTSTFPAAGAGGISLNTFVKASFSPAIDPSSINDQSLVVTDAISGQRVSGTVSADGTTAILWRLSTSSRLTPNRTYTGTLSPNIRGSNGAPFGRTHSFSFTTVSQIDSAEVRPERIRITIPDAEGHSRVIGDPGAIPAQWNAVAIRRGVDFTQSPQASAAGDGSFSFTIAEPVALTDLIDLQVINSAGAIAAIIPLTPFASEDLRSFVAPPNRSVRFTTRDGIVVSIPAGTFDQPTVVTATPAQKEAFATVATFDTDLTYAASVRLDFQGLPNKKIQIEIPLPAATDPSRTSYLLGRLDETTRGPKIMIVDTLRIAGGRFTTELAASQSNAAAPLKARTTVAGGPLVGAEVKSFLNGVNRAGTYLVTEIKDAGSGYAFAALDGVQAGYDLFVDRLQSLYAKLEHLIEGHRVAVPVLVGKTFEIVGVDATTGLQAFARAYDPLPLGDPGAAYIVPTPNPDTRGPYPVFGTPFRIDVVDIEAEDAPIETVRNFDVLLKNGRIRATDRASDPLPAQLSASMLNVVKATLDASRAGGLELDGAVGDRIILASEEREVDPSSALSVVFSEPISLGGNTDDAVIDNFLRALITFEKRTAPQTTYTDISPLVRYRSDSQRRRVLFEVPALERGAEYRVSLSPLIADDAGMRLGQVTAAGKLAEPLRLYFRTRAPGGKLASFDITSGQIRDTSLNGNILLVAAMDGGLFAYDVADPASLNSSTAPLGHAPSGVVDYWSLASDHHGRVFATTQSDAMGGVQSFDLDDFLPKTPPSVIKPRGAAVVSWNLGANASVGVLTSTTISDRPEGIPRKIQILLQDDEESFATRAAFVTATNATATKIDAEFDSFVVSVPMNPLSGTHAGANPYLVQRITIENQSLDLRWSADARRGAPAVIDGVIARAGDRIRILRNRTTYGVIAIFGYGIAVYDLNAMESNDAPNRPSDYEPVRELVRSTRAAIDAPDMFRPVPCSDCLNTRWAIPDLTFTPDAAILTRLGKTDLHVFALDATRGVLDLTISPPLSEAAGATSPTQSLNERGGDGLVFRGQFLGANGPEFHHHPRIEKLRAQFRTLAQRDPLGRFTGVARYHWRLEAQDNKVVGPPVAPSIVNADAGARGSIAGTEVVRDYLLIPANEYGLLIVEVAGNPPPIEIQQYQPLGDQHLADIIWIPSGAQSVRMIPRTNLAAVLDGQGRVLLVDLSRIDERFLSDGHKRPDGELFPSVARSLSRKGAYGIGVDDPRIVWKSEPGVGSGTLAPLVDGDTGFLFASKPIDPATGLPADRRTTVLAAVDPRIQMKADIGAPGGLAEVGGIVPMGVSPPSRSLASSSGSLAAFRLEMSLPGAITESLPAGKIQVAVESERVFNAITEQTAAPLPRSHLRVKQRDGSPDSRPAPAFTMQRVVPASLAAKLRHQRGFNKFISPWVIAIADPRASIQYQWPAGTTAAVKEMAGCFACERLSYLQGKSESDGVWEMYANGRIISVRPDLCSGTCTTNVFTGTPYSYLGERDRLTARFGSIMADTVRDPQVLTAGHNPAVAGGAVQETVYLHSGEVETGAADLDAGGVNGWNVVFDRTYRSRTIGAGALGRGWDSGLMRRIRPLPTGDVEYRDGSGEIWLFKFLNSPGRYESPKGLFLTLTRSERGWRLLDQKWRMTDFDAMGRMVSEADEYVINPAVNDAGNIVRYLYGTDGRLAQVIDPVGRASQVRWNGAGYIEAIVDWRGRTLNYDYDAEGRLTSVALPNVVNTSNKRPVINYGYGSTGASYNDRLELGANLATITDPGQTKPRVTFAYGTGTTRDKLVGEDWTATGEKVELTYTTDIHIDVLDALKQKRSYTISSPSLDYAEDRPHTILLEEHDVPTSKVPMGQLPQTAAPIKPDDREGRDRTFTFKYDAEGLLESSILENVRSTRFKYEALKGGPGKILVQTQTSAAGSGPAASPVTVDITYQTVQNGGSFVEAMAADDGNGTPLKVFTSEPHRGNKAATTRNDDVVQVVQRDVKGRPEKVRSSGGTVSPGGGAATDLRYHASDAPLKHLRGLTEKVIRPGLDDVELAYPTPTTTRSVDERKVETLTTVDDWQRVQQVVTSDAQAPLANSYKYDASGHLAETIRKQGAMDVTSRQTYDALGRITSSTVDNIAAVGGQAKEEWTYDLGKRTIQHKLASGATITEELDSLGRIQTRTTVSGTGVTKREDFAYDILGNLVVSSNDHVASATAYDIHGRAIETLSADGTRSKTVYDAWGHATSVEQFDSRGKSLGIQAFEVTPSGRLRKAVTTVDKTATGTITRTTNYQWDGAGRPASTEVEGRRVLSVFDDAGKLTSRSVSFGAPGSTISLILEELKATGHEGTLLSGFDVEDQKKAKVAHSNRYNTAGDVIKAKVGALSWDQRFDQAGNLVSSSPPQRGGMSYEYDSRGAITREVFPDGSAIKRQYDALGQPTVYEDQVNEITRTDNDALGNPASRAYADGTSESFTYDAERISTYTDRQGRIYAYVWNAKGQLTEIRDKSGSALERFSYDDAGRLTQHATADAAIEYSDFDLEGKPKRTVQKRFVAGSNPPVLIDEYEQRHQYNVYGERTSWTMPSYAKWSSKAPWITEVRESYDGAGNLESISRVIGAAATPLMTASFQKIGQPDERTVTTTSGATIVRKYSYDPEGRRSGLEVSANRRVIAGASVTFDGVQIGRAALLGISGGKRANQYTYDVRGRLESAYFARESGPPANEVLTKADFREALDRPQVDPAAVPSLTMKEAPGHKISELTRAGETRSFQYKGAERVDDGKFLYTFNARGRLAQIEEKILPSAQPAIRRVLFFYAGNDRLVGRRAEYATVTNGAADPWKLEDRSDVLANDGLPADTTFVFDPLSDRLVSIYRTGSSENPAIDANGGLVRQMLHGGGSYDDPLEVAVADAGAADGVTRLYPIYDEAAAGILQAIVNASGELVSRTVIEGAYGEDEFTINGPAIDKIELRAKKNAKGDLQQMDVTMRSTEELSASTLSIGVRLAAVTSDGTVVHTSAAAPTQADAFTIAWTLDAGEWTALTSAPKAEALSIAAASRLRAPAWSSTTTVVPPPSFMMTSKPVFTSSTLPVEYRESFTATNTWLASMKPGEEKSQTLYEVERLSAIGERADNVRGPAKSVRLATSAAFQALPFVEPVTGSVYARHRWVDPRTGTFLTPDRMGYRDSSNLYAFCRGNPVGCRDPEGLAGYFFDGTWNDREVMQVPTNVAQLREAYQGTRIYLPGVGTKPWTKHFGGLTGAGGRNRLEDMYDRLVETYNAGDQNIDIFGFSRGGAQAVAFANLIRERGIPDTSTARVEYHVREDGSYRAETVYGRYFKPTVRFLGVFDVVGSFGLPGNDIDIGYDLSRPTNVSVIRHATAADEKRFFFPLTSMLDEHGHAPGNVAELAFPGAHSDVGGGYPDTNNALSRGPLGWMWREAAAAGVPLGPLRKSQITVPSNARMHDESGAIERAIESAYEAVGWTYQRKVYRQRSGR